MGSKVALLPSGLMGRDHHLYNRHFRRRLERREHLRPTLVAGQSVRKNKAVVMDGDGDTFSKDHQK